MNRTLKLLTALPLVALITACVGADNTVNTQGEMEATLDQDLDGDGTVPGPGGVPVRP